MYVSKLKSSMFSILSMSKICFSNKEPISLSNSKQVYTRSFNCYEKLKTNTCHVSVVTWFMVSKCMVGFKILYISVASLRAKFYGYIEGIGCALTNNL